MMDDFDKPIRTTAGECSSFHVLYGDDYCSDDAESECSDYTYETLSEAESECSDCSYQTIDSDEGESSSLFTITEETEDDLISPIKTPQKIRISLGAYLEQDERRRQLNNLALTTHEEVVEENATDATSESSLGPEEACLQESFASFGFDESKSSNSSSNASLKSLSFSSLGTDDAKSVDSSSTTGSLKIALLKLQRAISADKLKRAIEAAELSSSFRKDERTTSKCIDSLEMSLLSSPENSRATEQYREARSNLLSVMSASKQALE